MKVFEKFLYQWGLGAIFLAFGTLFFAIKLHDLGWFFTIVGTLLIIVSFTRFRIHTAYVEEDYSDDF